VDTLSPAPGASRRPWLAFLWLLCAAGPLVLGMQPAAARPPGQVRRAVSRPVPAEHVGIAVEGRPLPVAGLLVRGEVVAPAQALAWALGGSVLRTAGAGLLVTVAGRRLAVSPLPGTPEIAGLLPAAPVEPLAPEPAVYVPLWRVAAALGDRVRWDGAGIRANLAEPPPVLPVPAAPPVPPAPVSPPRKAVTQPAPAADPVVPAAVVPYTPQELDDMARVVDGEADGQPYLALVGVAAVIVNRVRSGRFPDTIPGVIYAPGQFQAVGGPLYEEGPGPEDVSAALAALHGEDPTHGALYFFNPATTWSGSWIFTLPVLATIGAIRFAA
jgi:hypothetical protein